MTLAHAFMVGGFLLITAGVAALSWPVALIVAGAVLFISGGLELRRSASGLTERIK